MLRKINENTIVQIHENPYSSNTYIIVSSTHAIVIDPGISTTDEVCEVRKYLEVSGVRDVYIIHTHMHFDHVASTALLRRYLSDSGFRVLVLHHCSEAEYLERGDSYVTLAVPFFNSVLEPTQIDLAVTDSYKLSIGEYMVEVIHTPGHTIGSICLVVPKLRVVFTGDTVFSDGVPGRVDVPTSSPQDLVSSLLKLRSKLRGEYLVLPGHGRLYRGLLEELIERCLRYLT